MRTVLAFLIAPAVAVVGVSSVGALTEAGAGPTWLEAFGQYAVSSVFACNAASYIFGTPCFYLLRYKKWETMRNDAIAGALAGLVIFAVLSSIAIWPDSIADFIVSSLVGAVGFAALGTMVAACFAWIAGVKKPGDKASFAGP